MEDLVEDLVEDLEDLGEALGDLGEDLGDLGDMGNSTVQGLVFKIYKKFNFFIIKNVGF